MSRIRLASALFKNGGIVHVIAETKAAARVKACYKRYLDGCLAESEFEVAYIASRPADDADWHLSSDDLQKKYKINPADIIAEAKDHVLPTMRDLLGLYRDNPINLNGD